MTSPQPLRDIRPSPIAGRWYPGDAKRLSYSIDEMIESADVPPIDGQLIGVLAPHAGHHYSGPVAAYAFKLIKGMDVDLVALVGPSHQAYGARLITTGHDAYVTPLGPVRVSQAVLDDLRQIIPLPAVRLDQEHSLEIELPFLQRTLGSFELVPLALIDQSVSMAEELGRALSSVLAGKNALLVASSDLSHFYPQAVASELDHEVLDAVAAFDPIRVIKAEERGLGFACGRGAIGAVMIAARALGADTAQVLNYATSGDITHDYNQVVGYGAAAFYRASANRS